MRNQNSTTAKTWESSVWSTTKNRKSMMKSCTQSKKTLENNMKCTKWLNKWFGSNKALLRNASSNLWRKLTWCLPRSVRRFTRNSKSSSMLVLILPGVAKAPFSVLLRSKNRVPATQGPVLLTPLEAGVDLTALSTARCALAPQLVSERTFSTT